RAGHAASAPGLLPRAWGAAALRRGRLPSVVIRDGPARRGPGHDGCRLLPSAGRGGARVRHTGHARLVAGCGGPAAGGGRLREPGRAARLGTAVGPVRPGRGVADLLSVVPARRGWPATSCDGGGGPAGSRPAPADPADQRRARAVAGPWAGHLVAGCGRGAGRCGPPAGRAPGRPLVYAALRSLPPAPPPP